MRSEHDHFAYSLKPQLAGEGGDPDRAVFTEGGYARHEPHCFEGDPGRDQFARNKYHIYYPKGQVQQQYPDSVGRTVAIRTLDYKLVYRPTGVNELYEMTSDPRSWTTATMIRRWPAFNGNWKSRFSNGTSTRRM